MTGLWIDHIIYLHDSTLRIESSNAKPNLRWDVSGAGTRPEKQFRGGLVFKARRLLYHSSLGRE